MLLITGPSFFGTSIQWGCIILPSSSHPHITGSLLPPDEKEQAFSCLHLMQTYCFPMMRNRQHKLHQIVHRDGAGDRTTIQCADERFLHCNGYATLRRTRSLPGFFYRLSSFVYASSHLIFPEGSLFEDILIWYRLALALAWDYSCADLHCWDEYIIPIRDFPLWRRNPNVLHECDYP